MDDPVDALLDTLLAKRPTSGPPMIYDIEIDNLRAPTQADLDAFQAISEAYSALRRHVDATHAKLMVRIAKIRSEAGLPS